MDSERDRFQIQVQVTPLAGVFMAVGGSVLSLTGRDMDLVLDQSLGAGTAVEVQAQNWLMLGEVLYCVKERSRHKTRLRLEHALPSIRELTNMSRRFFGQATRAPLTERDSYSGYS